MIERPLEHGNAGYMQGPMTAVNFVYRRPGVFRDFVFGSPAGEIIGRIVGSRTIRMYHDYVFSKQPGCGKVVPWHTDGGGYALAGEMMPNLWVALTPAHAGNGRLEFIGGFHREFVARRWSELFGEALPAPAPVATVRAEEPAHFRLVLWRDEQGKRRIRPEVRYGEVAVDAQGRVHHPFGDEVRLELPHR